MDKLALAKQRMRISFIVCIAVVGWGAGWRMATHGDIFWMLLDGFPIVLIVMASQRCKQLIQELENQSAPSDSPTPPEDE